jgi:UDP-glucose 4-epimerase
MRVLLIGGYGYIGSALACAFDSLEVDYDICDIGLRGRPSHVKEARYKIDFINLNSSAVKGYDSIVCLAGVSSVSSAEDNPYLAIKSNILAHQQLLNISKGKLLIYASSGSVYDGVRDAIVSEESALRPSRNIYDLTKLFSDELSRLSTNNYISLRLGTVSGPSPNLRQDLVINKMVHDALTKREINLMNADSKRSIAAIKDVTNLITLMLKGTTRSFGLYNVGSFNTTIGDIASEISRQIGAKVIVGKGSRTYDFSMSVDKIRDAYNYRKFQTLQEVVQDLENFYLTSQN